MWTGDRHTLMATARNYIAGEWGETRRDFEVLNPATLGVLGHASVATKAEMDRAVDAANAALAVWGDDSKWAWVKRAAVVDDLVQLVKAQAEQIAVLMTKESGKHINESRADVIEGIHMLQYCAGRGRMPIGEKISSEIPGKEAETYLSPRGVNDVIVPWNFPFAIITWLLGPSVVCGCPVILKPSEETPLTAEFLVYLWDRVAKKHNVPPGVVNLINGVGQKVKQIAAEHHDKFAVCEMGGKNSMIVLRDADMDIAVNAAILGAHKTAHQRCVSPDLFIVDELVEPEFTRRFLEITERVKFGDPFDPDSFAGPLINQKAVAKWVRHGVKVADEGAEGLLLGIADHNATSRSNFVRPNVFRMKYRPNTFA